MQGRTATHSDSKDGTLIHVSPAGPGAYNPSRRCVKWN